MMSKALPCSKRLLISAIAMVFACLSSQTARADAWWIVSLFHNTTLEECKTFAQASFKLLKAKEIKLGTQVVYGFNLRGNHDHDSIIRCQGGREVPAIGTSDFAVIFIVYNRNRDERNAGAAKQLANQLADNYEAIAAKN